MGGGGGGGAASRNSRDRDAVEALVNDAELRAEMRREIAEIDAAARRGASLTDEARGAQAAVRDAVDTIAHDYGRTAASAGAEARALRLQLREAEIARHGLERAAAQQQRQEEDDVPPPLPPLPPVAAPAPAGGGRGLTRAPPGRAALPGLAGRSVPQTPPPPPPAMSRDISRPMVPTSGPATPATPVRTLPAVDESVYLSGLDT